jgi:SAM-dependent methyltransferase
LRFETPYSSVNEKPVLINFDRSLVENSSFINTTGGSLVQRRESGVFKSLREIFQGTSRITQKNVDVLIDEIKQVNDAKILIIGGGEIGSGLNKFYNIFSENIIAFDIYDSNNIDIVADAHNIPFKDGYFDAVIVQAVLEHVLSPHIVVSEIERVLKMEGIVYAETPFIQQVHEGPYDFTRFTESGHRYLFKRFKTISSGYNAGVGTSLIWSLDFFFSGLFRSRVVGKIARAFFFWLRFFDHLIPAPFNLDGACGVFFLGSKNDNDMADKDIIRHYKGNQR